MPSANSARTLAGELIPPAGIRNASRNTQGLHDRKRFDDALEIEARVGQLPSRAAPRCPPARRGCSITIASGRRPFFIHLRNSSPTARVSDRIGINATRGKSTVSSGRSERQARTGHDRVGAAQAGLANVATYCDTARMTLTAIVPRPLTISRARRISRSSATRLACLDRSLVPQARGGLHQIGMVPAQFDAGESAHAAGSGHRPGQAMRGNSDAHAS